MTGETGPTIVDDAGANPYADHAGGLLRTEGGVLASDTQTNCYTVHKRVGLVSCRVRYAGHFSACSEALLLACAYRSTPSVPLGSNHMIIVYGSKAPRGSLARRTASG